MELAEDFMNRAKELEAQAAAPSTKADTASRTTADHQSGLEIDR
jgi:hypothetical protein